MVASGFSPENVSELSREDSLRSAREIIPLLLELIQPQSVVDVGCGVGTWLSVFKEFGIEDCLGIDGDYIDTKTLQISPTEFLPFDLQKPLQINRKFDLVVSLEFAQNLPIDCAKIFIDSLTNLGSVILFSAAIPSQRETSSLNEQWPNYWAQHFQKNGYLVIDYLRKKIWNNENVEPCYAQNLILFVDSNSIEKYPSFYREFQNTDTSQLAIIHPQIYLKSFSIIENKFRSINFDSLISLIPKKIVEQTPSVVPTIREIRQQLADFLLNIPPENIENTYSSSVGKVHKMILDSGIKGELLTNTEQHFVDLLAANIARGFDDPKAIQYLLVAMLYCQAYHLPLTYDFTCTPLWFLKEYLKFILYYPGYFQEVEEVDKYYRHIQKLVNYVNLNIFNNQNSELWHNIASFVIKSINITSLYFITENLRDIFTKSADIAELVLKRRDYKIDYTFPERPANRKKIRLGVLKNHFFPHPETYNTLPVFEYLDRDKFEIILYAIEVNNHPLEQYCQSRADRLIKLPNDTPNQVQTIRADDLDILFIATTFLISLVLHRLARIQTTYFVSPVTTGARNVDYYISGNLLEPLGSQAHYREQLVTIDGTGFCFNFTSEPDAPTIQLNRKILGVPDESVVFISGASFFKIIPELRVTWAKIMAAVPKAVLLLYPFSPIWDTQYAKQFLFGKLTAFFTKYGIEKNRLIILDIQGRSNVKECLKLGDIYLDSCPYSGATTTVEALEVGLPTVVMEGNALRSRTAASLLRELQMPDLIANSEEAYVQLAIALAQDANLRQQKSAQIKQKMQQPPRFMDSRSYSKQMESLFQELYRQKFNSGK
ncbi:methyltransferase domain-containing protein [Chlorogloeopsis sp. ULAP01]|uniref:O-linked N-acetylglucosamine transferase family protein n=1 Tax=Chlorogloeopsis sp. ULAP01 TaxID=3056483 RepID=UPI0025AAB074|nr:methyltransferase domain-containing protein [Chlorogloeopsis sp. ULAP01]MDM9382142.1 methyltransferase domain-containing protein [Chlorogloeopsis sp. ULAP01]